MSRLIRLLLVAACIACLASGCTTLRALFGDVTKPELTFKRLELSGLSFESATLGVVYEIDNPYEIPIELAHVDYQLAVEGKRVFSGSPNEGVRIPAGRSREVTFPARVRYAELGSVARAIFSKERLQWRAAGNLGVDTPVGMLQFPLSKSGTFDRPQLPQVRIAAVRAPTVRATGADLRVALDVRNSNPFPMPLEALDYALNVGGKRVGTGSVRGARVAAGGTQRIELPVEVGFAQAAGGLRRLLAGEATDVSIDGRLDFGSIGGPLEVARRIALDR